EQYWESNLATSTVSAIENSSTIKDIRDSLLSENRETLLQEFFEKKEESNLYNVMNKDKGRSLSKPSIEEVKPIINNILEEYISKELYQKIDDFFVYLQCIGAYYEGNLEKHLTDSSLSRISKMRVKTTNDIRSQAMNILAERAQKALNNDENGIMRRSPYLGT
ncbi:MAG: hypothetical protein PHR46_01880, partial [Candidatus Absconditabacteria bacterium]|nr:hypothetical protein [Candidatus Absconditabacteria bacterium]